MKWYNIWINYVIENFCWRRHCFEWLIKIHFQYMVPCIAAQLGKSRFCVATTSSTEWNNLSAYLSTSDDRYLSATRLILFCRWLNLTNKKRACLSSSASLAFVLGLLAKTLRKTWKILSPIAAIHCQMPGEKWLQKRIQYVHTAQPKVTTNSQNGDW